jgi:hypothetical protein
MNKLLENLLIIHEKIASVETFMPIKAHIENLAQDENYKKLVKDTDLLVRVLTAFEKSVRDHPAEAS